MRQDIRHPPALRMLWRAIFWVSFPFGILWFVLPVYGRELGATALEVGALFSVPSFVPVIVRPFLGRALDRWGRRPFLLIGLGGYVVALVVFCLADTVALLAVARFVEPAEFEDYASMARAKGFLLVSATPLTRSSYHADRDFAALKEARLKALGA